jgi:hypothetical protein
MFGAWGHVEEALFRAASAGVDVGVVRVGDSDSPLLAADARGTSEYRRLGRVLYRLRNSHRMQAYYGAMARLYRALGRLGAADWAARDALLAARGGDASRAHWLRALTLRLSSVVALAARAMQLLQAHLAARMDGQYSAVLFLMASAAAAAARVRRAAAAAAARYTQLARGLERAPALAAAPPPSAPARVAERMFGPLPRFLDVRDVLARLDELPAESRDLPALLAAMASAPPPPPSIAATDAAATASAAASDDDDAVLRQFLAAREGAAARRPAEAADELDALWAAKAGPRLRKRRRAPGE